MSTHKSQTSFAQFMGLVYNIGILFMMWTLVWGLMSKAHTWVYESMYCDSFTFGPISYMSRLSLPCPDKRQQVALYANMIISMFVIFLGWMLVCFAPRW
jgi:hypothetical protein